MRKFISASAVAVLAGVIMITSVATAVDNGGVGGKPANPQADNPRSKSIFIYTLKPGETKDDAIRIVNATSSSKNVHVYPVDGALASGGAFTCAQEVETRKDVGSWITMSQSNVTVEANSDVVVPFTVTAPTKPDVGEHDGCIAIQDTSTGKSDKGGVQLSFRTAIRVAVTIPGKIVKSLQVVKVSTSSGPGNNFIVQPLVKNSGNVSLDTQLKTILEPIVGTRVTVNNGSYPILPRSSASWNFEVKRPFWGGLYHAKVVASFNADPSSGIGAKNTDRKVVSSQSGLVFVAPQGLALIIELVVLALIVALVVLWFIRQQQHHHVRNRWSKYKVKQNDTIVKVAEQHNVPWKRLAAANKLKAPYHLEPGQELKVPPQKAG